MYGIFFNDLHKDYIGHIMAECYGERIYDQFVRGPTKDLTILEVGGNVGAVTLYLSQFAKALYVLEPAAQHLAALRQTVAFNHLTHVTVIPKALAAENGEALFYHNPYNHTMFSLINGEGPTADSEKVTCTSIGSLLDEYNLGSIDFVKLDVEGSELDILTGESFRREAPRIHSMLVEHHSWGGEVKRLEQALTENGYHWWRIPAQATLYGAVRREKILC